MADTRQLFLLFVLIQTLVLTGIAIMTDDIIGPSGAQTVLKRVNGIDVIANDGIIKSDMEKCKYRHLTLPNGLQALLMSEEGLDKV